MRTARLRAARLLLLAAALTSCARTEGPGPAPEADPPTATQPPSPAPGGSDLPAVDVLDLVSGQTVSLAALTPAERPTLVWFWAPT